MKRSSLFIFFSKFENLFLLIFLTFGMAFILITPPGQNPDELTHVQRAWQLAGLDVLSDGNDQTLENDIGGYLPSGLLSYFIDNGYFYSTDQSHKFGGLSYSIDKQHVPKTKYVFQDFKGAALYSPVGYIPYVPIVWIGEVFNTPISITFYLMRMAALILAAFVMFVAIKVTPIGKWIFFVIGLLPMFISQSASVSIDWAVLSMCSLFIAFILSLASKKSNINSRSSLALLFLVLAIVLTKVTYAPIALCALLIPLLNQKYRNTKSLMYVFIPIIIAAIIGLIWLKLTSYIGGQAGADIEAQKEFIATNPLEYLAIIIRTFITSTDPNTTPIIWLAFFGNFGYLSAPLPMIFILLSFSSLLFSIGLSEKEESTTLLSRKNAFSARLVIGASALITTTGISTALYLYFTDVGAMTVRGIQGRYLIPVALLIMLAFKGFMQFKNQEKIKIFAVISPVIVLVASLITIYSRYY